MNLDEIIQVLDVVPEYVFILTEEGEILGFNKLVEEDLGYSREDLYGSKATKLHPPEYTEEVIKTIGEILRGVKDICTLPLLGKKGEVIPAETRITPIKLDGKDVLLAISRDISQRVEYERRISEKQKELKKLLSEWDTIFNSINDLISIHDKDFRVVRANRALLEFLGVSEEEIMGKHCYEIFHKKEEPWPECPHSSALNEKRPVDTEVDDPNIGVPLLISCSPIYDEKGEITGTVHIAKDITRLKKMEEELLRAKNLESLGYVAGGIAHDFNNLLTGILGNIAMAGLKLGEPVEAERHLKTAERACEQARELTGKLLVFAEGGIPNSEEVDLDSLIGDLVLLYLDPKLYKTEVSLSGGVTVVGDREFLRKAFSAIILNAREAMPDGGEFRVFDEVRELEEGNIYGLAPGRYLRISLSDTGKGIESGIMDKIFDPYFTTKPMDYRKGTGLGLATAFWAIKKHRGTITVESEVGHGATFHVYLPAGISEKVEKKDLANRRKVLYVDDEKVVRDVASEMLSALGIKVFTAVSGEDGLEILKEQGAVDLAIIDLTIRSGSGGVEALRMLKRELPALRAIATSGLLNDFEKESLLNEGFIGVLEKPFGMKELKRALENVHLI